MTMRLCVSTVLAGLAFISAPLAAGAQTVAYFGFTPMVLTSESPAQVLFTAEITGQPTRVTLDFSPGGVGAVTTLALRDDGTGGDRVAGDRIYSVLLSTAAIIGAMRPDDVHRVFVGYLNLVSGTTSVLRGNIFADVYTSEVGASPIVQLSPSVQATSRFVNINDPAVFTGGDLSRVTREFYRWFGDDYDFLNIVYAPARFLNRTHFQVKNEVDGIGLVRADNTARYGSAGRLQGISQFPTPGFFDGAENGYIHELGHQWINFMNVAPFASGIPHWPISSMAGGVMGFSVAANGNEGGTFACDIVEQNGSVRLNARPNGPVYNDLDLYLIGLMPASQVRSQIVFPDQAAAQSISCNGQVFTGAVTRVTAQTIIDEYGPRKPAADEAPTRFRIATILVTRDGLVPPQAMWLYGWFVDRAEWRAPVPVHSGLLKQTASPFHVATGQRGSLDTHVTLAMQDFSLVPTQGTATVTAGTPATFKIGLLPTGASFDSTVTVSCGTLPAHASCTVAPARVTPGAGTALALSISTEDSAKVAPGTYIVTISGTADSTQHSTVVGVTVR